MKKCNFILMVFMALLTLSSCEKYLTVTPKTEMPQELLFSTENGFKDALAGVYILMKSNNAYGGAMTQTTIENLTSSWDVSSGKLDQKLGLFRYDDADVENALSSILKQEYAIISRVNAILAQIDVKKDVFKTDGLYEMIKAECLGIRAYCHLDIIRLFGPIPSNPANGSMLAYVTRLSADINTRISFQEYETALLKDLAEAEMLVKDMDPITKWSLRELRAPGGYGITYDPADTFFAYRYLRMNYYAIKALQARTYLWFNNKEKAYECAKYVIDAKNNDGSEKFVLGSSADFGIKDFVLSKEHIFGLYDFDMFNKYTDRYSGGVLKKGTSATTITNTLYGNTGTDIRESGLWDLVTLTNGSKVYITKKYQAIDNKTVTATTDFKQIPMLRISEMYLIAAETAPFAEGQNYFKLFRTARNIGQLGLPQTPDVLQSEIIKEYRKEFYAEGQGFFAYKRLSVNKPAFLFAPSAATVNYLIPLPRVENIAQN